MLVHQIERISRSLLIDEVIVATTDGPTDDAIVQVAEEAGAAVFRGDEEDVLGRVVGALKAFDVALHVECFGDSPLMDPTILDVVIGFYLKHQDQYDLVATGMKTTFPPGLDVTVYPSSVLFDVDDLVVSPEDREYVGINIKRRPDDFRLFTVEAPQHFRYPEYYLEVDTPQDLELIRKIYASLYPGNSSFLLPDVVSFLKAHPDLAASNRDVKRKWKAFRQE